MTSTNIEDLFDIHRLHEQQDFHKILLYFPLGLILLLLRLSLAVLILPLLSVLPRLSKLRCSILKGISIIFGVIVKYDETNKDEKSKLLMCNHISVLDHTVIDTIWPCKLINTVQSRRSSISALWRNLDSDSSRSEASHNVVNSLKKHVADSDVPILIFPEGTMTNGRVGLLKFTSGPFALNLPIQPVLLKVAAKTFINISPSLAGTSAWCDFLWLLFVPYTVFTLRFLPPMEKTEKESPEEFSKRVQYAMAAALRLTPTVYTYKDKVEYAKRLQVSNGGSSVHPSYRRERAQASPSPGLNRMAKQIKEVLPAVPMNVILQDLGITRNVDATISRLLEGVIHYVPEPLPSSSNSASSSNSSLDIKVEPSTSFSSTGPLADSTLKLNSETQNFPPLNAAAKNFGKSSKERMMSYQERKTMLIESARIRYMQKHGLM